MNEQTRRLADGVIAQQEVPKLDNDVLKRLATGTVQCWHSDAVYMATELLTLRAEVERLTSADAFSRKELARGNEIIDGLRIERDTLAARVGELEKELADVRAELEGADQIIDALNSEVK